MAARSPSTEEASGKWRDFKTIEQCNRYMLNHQHECDVAFVVGPSGNQELIHAHKYMLSARSSVFSKIFKEAEKDINKPIGVPDVNPLAFKTLLTFLYCGDTSIDDHLLQEVTDVANKYDVKELVRHCQEHTRMKINLGNIFETLNMSLMHSDHATKGACLQYIYQNTKDVFGIEEFLNIPHACITAIMKEHKLTMKEDEIFDNILRWVEAECNRQNTNVINGQTVRHVLGNAILENIWFFQMSRDYFQSNITHKLAGMLKDSKIEEIRQFLFNDEVNPPNEDLEFPKRLIFLRFRKTSSGKVYRNAEDALSFTVSNTVKLHTLFIYGSCQHPGQYKFDVKILRESDKALIFHAGNISKDTDGHFKIYEIPVNESVVDGSAIIFEKDKLYSIVMKMHGPTSFLGEGGRHQMTCDGTTIKFLTNLEGLNGTTQERGQFPGFILEKVD